MVAGEEVSTKWRKPASKTGRRSELVEVTPTVNFRDNFIFRSFRRTRREEIIGGE